MYQYFCTFSKIFDLLVNRSAWLSILNKENGLLFWNSLEYFNIFLRLVSEKLPSNIIFCANINVSWSTMPNILLLTDFKCNSNGERCILPFIYKSKEYRACTATGNAEGVPWCPVELPRNGRPKISSCALCSGHNKLLIVISVALRLVKCGAVHASC